MNKERRGGFDGNAFEMRMAGPDGGDAPSETVGVEGYAALFDTPTMIGDWFEERIAPGAFAAALARPDDVILSVNHQEMPLARNTSGTLILKEDERGLHVSADLLLADPDVQGVVHKMERRDLSHMSFLFVATKDRWDYSDENLTKRTIDEVRLFDVAIVGRPAYEGADIAFRSAEKAIEAEARRRNYEGAEMRHRIDLAKRRHAA